MERDVQREESVGCGFWLNQLLFMGIWGAQGRLPIIISRPLKCRKFHSMEVPKESNQSSRVKRLLIVILLQECDKLQ